MIAGIVTVVYVRARRQAHEAMRSDLRIRAKTLAGVMEIERGKIEFEMPPNAIPEYERPGSGAYAAIVDTDGKTVVRSPSLEERTLPVRAPWKRGEYVFDELERGPDGFPCATVTHSFVAGVGDGEEEGSTAPPPPPEEGRRYRICVALDSRDRDAGLAALAIFLAVTGAGALLVTVGGGLLIARRVLRPVARMTEEAARLTPEDTTKRLGPDGVVTELTSLATTLNSALDRLGDALDRQRQFTSDAGHELRTPVSVLLGNSELLLRRPRRAEEYREGLERQRRIALRMRDLTENLLTLARADASGDGLKREVVRPGDVLASMCEEFRMLARERDVSIRCTVDEDLRVVGDPTGLEHLLQNLLSNALKFTPEGGRVEVSLGREGEHAVLTVADTGPGIPEEHRSRIFDRFYRVDEGKDRREGAGLGLAIVHWIVRAHGGRVDIASSPGGGAAFEVRLPLADGI